MASFKVCFALGLFVIALSPTGFSEDVPDDVVYTEIKKTLVNGTKGILTCQFKGTPYAVYWIKGSDSDITLSFIKWAYGSKYGPRYEDGSCDMDEKYSLIINNVRYEDAGRYNCEVSSYKGVLLHNFTDVTITSKGVKTQQSVSFQMGEVGVLPCQVNIRPKMVSWLKGINTTLVTTDLSRDVIEIGGPGYEEGLFNMSKEYSLVINDVTIQHEGYFFCEVTDFDTDKLYRDETLLTVFAQPTKPFPVIQECPMADQSNCIITTDSSVILKCNVNQYYPDINLVFMHGSERVESLTTITWNNTDGTKNRSVTISADISHDVYKCIASGIPGFDLIDEKFSSVRMIQRVQEQSNSSILAVIILPIVICLTVVLLAWLRLRQRSTQSSTRPVSVHMDIQDENSDATVNNRTQSSTRPVNVHMDIQDENSDATVNNRNRLSKEERYMRDHISYVELWKFVEFIVENNETYKLDGVMLVFHGPDGDKRSDQSSTDQEYYYQQFCRWKETCDQTINQRTTFYETCCQMNLDKCVQKVKEFGEDISTKVPSSDFEHILWQIGEPHKITKFLASIGLDTDEELLSKKKMVRAAVGRLSTWKQSTIPFNPVVILSFIMEMLDCCRASDNFFQIPPEEKDTLLDHEVERLIRDLTAITTHHWHKLASIIKSRKGSIKPNDPNDNNKVLFDVKKMLLDWWENMECSNYDKRRTLERISRGIFDVTESPANNRWPSDDELELLAGYPDSPTIESACAKLNIMSLHEKADKKERFEALCEWRTSSTEKDRPLLYGHLRSALEVVGVSGLLPPLRTDPVHKAEYVDIAFDLMMTDVLPVANVLGVIVTKLPEYRPLFEPSHLEKGTVGIIADLVESTKDGNSRLVLYHYLKEAGFTMTVAKNILVNQMAYGELFTISNSLKEGDCEHGVSDISNDEEKAPGESEHLLNGDDITSTEMEISFDEAKEEERLSTSGRVHGLSTGHFNEMKKMLQLTDEELAICSVTSERPDEFTLFRMWKERSHLVDSSDRAAIIQGLLDIGRTDIAISVAEGNFYGTEVSLNFIKCIVKKMDRNKVWQFEKAFDLQKEFRERALSNDVTSAIIHGFLRKIDCKSGQRIFGKTKDHRTFIIDKLVDNGFLDIARELINIHY